MLILFFSTVQNLYFCLCCEKYVQFGRIIFFKDFEQSNLNSNHRLRTIPEYFEFHGHVCC